jgi:lambda repressor-like predicted transcriptional regulator
LKNTYKGLKQDRHPASTQAALHDWRIPIRAWNAQDGAGSHSLSRRLKNTYKGLKLVIALRLFYFSKDWRIPIRAWNVPFPSSSEQENSGLKNTYKGLKQSRRILRNLARARLKNTYKGLKQLLVGLLVDVPLEIEEYL